MGEELYFPPEERSGALICGSDSFFALLLTTAYLALSAYLLIHHQLWIDEAFYFLHARDSAGIVELVSGYNVHPFLWNICVYLLKHLAPGILGMQILHSLFAAATVYLIGRYCPLGRGVRFLVAFGYFLLFEYNIIAKNYILGFFLVFLSLVLFQRNKSLPLMALLLGLASNTHLFTLFVSAFLFIYYYKHRYAHRSHFLAAGIYAVFLALALWQIVPPREVLDTHIAYGGGSLLSLERFGRTFGAPVRGLLNIPDFAGESFWNTNIIVNAGRKLSYLIGAALLLYALWCFRKRRDLCFLYVAPLALIMIFVYFAPLATGVRYWGYFYIMLFVCTWLYRLRSPVTADLGYLLKMVALLQFLVSIPVIKETTSRPFSNAEHAAGSISRAGLTGIPIFVRTLASGPSLSAYTGRKVYYPSVNRFESFSFDIKNNNLTNADFLQESLNDLHALGVDSCILATNQKIDETLFPALSARMSSISSHTGAIVGSEDYFLYLLVTTAK